MKKILSIGILALVCFSCSDFLEEKSQSEIRPSTLTDMEKILEGEGYFTQEEAFHFNYALEMLTDDWECVKAEDAEDEDYIRQSKENDLYKFSWDPTMFDENGGGEDITLWQVPYERIMGCNIVLDYIDAMTGDQDKKEYLKGEALALRGFYYWHLVNFFGWSYNDGDPTKELGVPLKLETAVTGEYLERNTVAEVYDQIITDMTQGAELMEKHPINVSISRLNALSAYALLSRVYLYMDDWDNVIKYATLVLDKNSKLTDLIYLPDNGEVYNQAYSDEILWQRTAYPQSSYVSIIPGYYISEDLLALYRKDLPYDTLRDVRAIDTISAAYLVRGGLSWDGSGYENSYVAGVSKGGAAGAGIRTAEVYLNRAEAFIRKFIAEGNSEYAESALEDLNDLRSHRFDSLAPYENKTLADFNNAGEKLLTFCLEERRRELVAEFNSRWFDLRRLGMPRIVHTYYMDGETTEYILEEKDRRYVLPIPERVIEQNPNLE